MDDLISALMKVAEYNGLQNIFNIGSGKAYTLHEILDIIIEKSALHFTDITYQNIRKCDVSKTILDISVAEKELNWSPQVDVDMGISLLLDNYAKHNF